MTPDFVRRLLAAARGCLAASDPHGVAAAPISTGSKIEPSLPPGSAARACLRHVEGELRNAASPRHLAHHGPRHQRLFDDPSLLVPAPTPSALNCENPPVHLSVTLKLALSSHPFATCALTARRPPPDGYGGNDRYRLAISLHQSVNVGGYVGLGACIISSHKGRDVLTPWAVPAHDIAPCP